MHSDESTQADLEAEFAKLKSAIIKSKNELIRWFIGGAFAIVSIIITFIKFSS